MGCIHGVVLSEAQGQLYLIEYNEKCLK